ncbi:probable phosphoglycerate mutase [Dethiosulfatibacter aminovorans DSM 17477]|uniref:Probable phosphoglycerate mutase n=1 Tax=Dethiosulfatibacter aminovorans DSM 17477 TaxID=1121476 RepID=A0A1M6B2M7_9FIRM|nr:histidine phosphatase family protein [Dethiosulfatibacter aminovorans]SHI42917.1 probable phosphoglycerate mutase [Dethiosulfatibacter aminovorans DSM 17477]
MYLYLIRHGETDWNVEKRMQGQIDINLNMNGVHQAKALGQKLKDEYDVKRLYSSPLTRAYMTGSIVGDILDLECEKRDELMEFNFGDWQGMTYDEIEKRYPRDWHNWKNCSHLVEISGGETLDQGYKRISEAIDEIVKSNDDNTAIITHGTSIEFYINYMMNTNIEEIKMERLIGKNTSIYKIYIDKKQNINRLEA